MKNGGKSKSVAFIILLIFMTCCCPSFVSSSTVRFPQHYAGRLWEVLSLHRGANQAVQLGCQTSQTDMVHIHLVGQ